MGKSDRRLDWDELTIPGNSFRRGQRRYSRSGRGCRFRRCRTDTVTLVGLIPAVRKPITAQTIRDAQVVRNASEVVSGVDVPRQRRAHIVGACKGKYGPELL